MLFILVYYVFYDLFWCVSVYVTTASGEERRHRCILKASYQRCESCEGSWPRRMCHFAIAETGAQHQQLPANSHTPSAECKRPLLWHTACKPPHKHNPVSTCCNLLVKRHKSRCLLTYNSLNRHLLDSVCHFQKQSQVKVIRVLMHVASRDMLIGFFF